MTLRTIFHFATTIIVALILGILIFVTSNSFFSIKNQQLKNEAVTSCLAASSQEATDIKNGTKSTYPLKDVYQKCMADKGYSTLWK